MVASYSPVKLGFLSDRPRAFTHVTYNVNGRPIAFYISCGAYVPYGRTLEAMRGMKRFVKRRCTPRRSTERVCI